MKLKVSCEQQGGGFITDTFVAQPVKLGFYMLDETKYDKLLKFDPMTTNLLQNSNY